MPSPFPGMNPYLEHPSIWHDFHESFMPIAREALIKQLLPRYFVKIDEHLFVHELDDESRHLAGRADLAVTRLSAFTESSQAGLQLLAAPAEVTAAYVDTESISYLEILDRDTQQVITVVELLNPSNKQTGSYREQYVSKVRQLMIARVNVVEIDLLRGGPRMPWRGMQACDYCVVVSRAEEEPKAGLWPIRLRDRLPEIPVPLRPGEADARLDLQSTPRPHLRFRRLWLLHLRQSAGACAVARRRGVGAGVCSCGQRQMMRALAWNWRLRALHFCLCHNASRPEFSFDARYRKSVRKK